DSTPHGSPAPVVARFLAACWLGGWRRQGAAALQPRAQLRSTAQALAKLASSPRSYPPPPPRQARATVPEGGVPGPRPPRRRRFEEVVWGAVGRVSATWMSPKSPHGRVHGVPDEAPPHRLHRDCTPQRPRARHSTDTRNLARSAGNTRNRGPETGTPRTGRGVPGSAWRGGSALVHRHVVARSGTGVDLARTADLGFRIGLLLQPMADPTGGTGNGEHHREHLGRNVQRLVDDARVKIDVRVQLALDEVLVLERGLLQAHRHLEQRIVHAQLVEHLVAHLADDGRARIEVLVDAVAEAHQAEARLLVLGAGDRLGDVLRTADLLQHLQ